MPSRPTSVIAAACTAALLLVAATPAFAAGLLDPLFRFRQIRTEHFIIYFHQDEEPLAQRLAALVEPVRTAVGAALQTTPPMRTHVILADQSEVANGWATPLPRDTVFLNAAAPSGADVIGRADDWLRLVFTHEYTHIVHLDRSGAWARLARGLFGRTPVAFPNLWLPQWNIEGLATWEESALTGQGREHAGDFLAIERVAAGAEHPLSLDRSSGGLIDWPDGHAAYAAGLGFHEYLATRFGQEAIAQLARSTSRRLPFLGTPSYKRVFGESLGTLWREYTAQISAPPTAAGPVSPRRLTGHGHIVVGPRFAPPACDGCDEQIVYSLRTPHAFPALMAVDASGGHDTRLTTRYQGSTVGLSSAAIVFDQQELHRSVGLYSDVYVLNRSSGHVHALTRGARLQDVDLSADGRSLVAVREHAGRRELVVASIEGTSTAPDDTRLGPITTLVSLPDTQFSAPRWSPDGRLIAVERRRLGALPDVLIVNRATGAPVRAIADRAARIVTPAWRPDGLALVAAADFDEKSFDLYEFPLADEPADARRLTWTNGALWPDVSTDGSTIVFAGYTADGYDVFSVPYFSGSADTRPLTATSAEPQAESHASALPSAAYVPWSTLPPTSWWPIAIASADQTRLGGGTGGADVLGRHAFSVDLSWLVSGPVVERPVDRATPDWSATYAYTRWHPSFFGTASRQTLFRGLRNGASGLTTVSVRQRELQAGVFVPLVHVRQNVQALASIVRTDDEYRLADRSPSVTLVASRFGVAFDTTHTYGYSVSREHGLNVGSTIELSRKALNSQGDATTTTLDVRAYAPGLGRHHVVALRGAAGLSNGDDVARQQFQLGEVLASPSVIDFGGSALGLMRGGVDGTRTGNRLLVGNVEYRLPLAVLERGHGTWPLFLRTAHASVFADIGEVRAPASARTRSRAVGAELSMDAVAGYGLPFVASVGAAWGRETGRSSGASIYARLGRAF